MGSEDHLKLVELELKAKELELKEMELAIQLIELQKKAQLIQKVQKVADTVTAPIKKVSAVIHHGKEVASFLIDEAQLALKTRIQHSSSRKCSDKNSNNEVRKLPTAETSESCNKFKEINWKRVGRNDLCPCGSGKKFKECHGRIAPDANNDELTLRTLCPQKNEDIDKEKWGSVGRNDLCPCGSGKKYKNCHGRII